MTETHTPLTQVRVKSAVMSGYRTKLDLTAFKNRPMSEVKASRVKRRPTTAIVQPPLSAKNDVDDVKSKCESALNGKAIYSDYSRFKRREVALSSDHHKSPLTLQTDYSPEPKANYLILPKSAKFRTLMTKTAVEPVVRELERKKPDYEAICDKIYSRISAV